MANQEGMCNNSKYEQYSSKDIELNIAMDYIADWRYSEHRGSYGSYAQVQFYKVVKDKIAPSFIVTVERSSKVKFTPLTIEGLADDLVKKRILIKDSTLVSQNETELLGLPALDLTLTYKKPDKMDSINPTLLPFQERIFIVQKDDKFYTIRYVNPLLAYEEFEQAFLHCIGTLLIKE